ncbi:cytochrome P450 [Aspergillus lucknowensis]|uniref:Cytochrome P450 n=1 Tax=Aspergillus lucknowensis TaxID=176173 RepID=A0ABR4LPP8_9EURO
MDPTILASLGLVIVLGLVLRPSKHDPREPPFLASRVPAIGHLIAFVVYGLRYFATQSAKTRVPAFSIDMLFNKVYVINSPKLVAAIRRNHRTMSLDPLFTRTAQCVGGIHGPGLQLLRGKESQGQGLGHATTAALRPALLGEGLDQLNRKMIGYLSKSVEQLKSRGTVDLYDWCTLAMTLASTEPIYGPMNPYSDSNAREAYWELEKNLSFLMMGVAPWLIARKAWKGREYLSRAFLQYYQADGHLNSSQLAYARWKTQHDGGAALEDIARLEAAMGLGILSNTVPSSFWAIFDIFSRPALLQEIRDEIWQNALSVTTEGVHTVDLADVQERCPLLLASFQEMLRLRSNSLQLRVIYEDTMLDDSYLVKAGSIIVIPASVINRDEAAWGADADAFNPQQFISTAAGEKRQKASAYMSFGSSPHICAGRHFATGEIVALLTMLILQFEIRPVAGEWVEPPTNVNAVAASLSPPLGQTSVTITERPEVEGVKWDFRLTPGRGRHGLIIG